MILAIFYYITKINQFSQVDFLSKNKEGVIKTPFFIIDFRSVEYAKRAKHKTTRYAGAET